MSIIEPYGTNEHLERIIGQRIKQYRLDRNITQADLAEQAGLARRTITSIEKGEGGTVNTLLRVLRALGRLNLIGELFEEPPVSPNRLREMELKKHTRKYASKPRKQSEAKPWVWEDEKP